MTIVDAAKQAWSRQANRQTQATHQLPVQARSLIETFEGLKTVMLHHEAAMQAHDFALLAAVS